MATSCGENPCTISFHQLNAKLCNLMPSLVNEFTIDIEEDTTGGAFMSQFDIAKQSLYDGDYGFCKIICQMLLDITWEHLNTGHWSDVNVTWRHTFAYLSLIKALSESALAEMKSRQPEVSIKDAIKTCDLGLLMGAPIMDNILTKVISHLQMLYSKQVSCESVNEEHSKEKSAVNVPKLSADHNLPRLECPSLESFQHHWFRNYRPLIVEGAIDFWPALSTRKWSLPYIKQVAGCRTVPVELGSKYTEETWSQALMTVEDFIVKHVETGDVGQIGYLAQHQLFDQIPELRRDIVIPDYCTLGKKEEVDINAWFGPCGTISPLHQDPKHNLLAQVVGKKYIRLYAVEDTESVYPHKERLLANTSQVDVENPNFNKFPKFSKAPYMDCILKPGEMLYIPPKVWHYVRSLSVSFSVSFWWE